MTERCVNQRQRNTSEVRMWFMEPNGMGWDGTGKRNIIEHKRYGTDVGRDGGI